MLESHRKDNLQQIQQERTGRTEDNFVRGKTASTGSQGNVHQIAVSPQQLYRRGQRGTELSPGKTVELTAATHSVSKSGLTARKQECISTTILPDNSEQTSEHVKCIYASQLSSNARVPLDKQKRRSFTRLSRISLRTGSIKLGMKKCTANEQ